MLRTVNMTTELAALLGELADAGERENLKASGVRQYRTVPGIKLVQSACLAQDSSEKCTPFTLPTVPTGMKIGVCIWPWSVVITPARASLALSLCCTSNFTSSLLLEL